VSTTLLIETPTHGRAILRAPVTLASAGLLVGFHGYAETAEIQMARLAAIPGANEWTLLSVQALHRFYRGRSEDVVGSWMTRQDRESAIADNVRYVDTAIGSVRTDDSTERIVVAGFSQGVAMAFRVAALGRRPCSGVIAVCGDFPPELAAGATRPLPPVLLMRGSDDEWYTQARFDTDVGILGLRANSLQPIVFDAGHEWGAAANESAGAFLSSLQRL
jgi:predicted esterase